MIKIAIINLKGGVGKSVTTCNVSALLPEIQQGARVLVVDLDKQANTTKFFQRLDYDSPAVDAVLLHPETIGQAITDTPVANVSLLPANMMLLSANRQVLMDCTQRQQDRLARALAQVDGNYDYCLMDCPPDIDMATINALCTADWVIIPVDCDEWALDGLNEIMDQIQSVQSAFNPNLSLLGILITKFTRTNHAVDTIKLLNATGLPVFRAGIRHATVVQAAKAAHQPIHKYSPHSPAAGDYRKLTREIVQVVSNVDTKEADGNE